MLQRISVFRDIKTVLSDCRALLRYRQFINQSKGIILDKMKQQRSIFIHIPKTGGKSIFTSLYEADIHDGFGHASIEFV